MSESFAEILNRECHCICIDHGALERETRRLLDGTGVELPPWSESSLFAAVPVFVSEEQIAAMHEVVLAVDAITNSQTYREIALARAPEIARHAVAQQGVFLVLTST